MPQITSVEPQKKKAGRFNIYLDGQFVAGVSAQAVLENKLKAGQAISNQELSKIILKEELSKLTDRVLRFLAVRPRSEREVFDYLVKKISKDQNVHYSQAKDSLLIKQIIGKLKKYQYLNDIEFARWWINSRIRTNPKGPNLLKFELIKKGIDREIIDSALKLFPSQLVIAKKIIAKKLKAWQKLPNLEFKKKIYQYLASRGFDSETIRAVFANLNRKR